MYLKAFDSSEVEAGGKALGPGTLTTPSAAEWWQSLRWVLLVFTVIVAIALAGSFVSYEQVVSSGHPWLPQNQCAGCLFCGMTRSFCAMSDGQWKLATQWNRGGPVLYVFFWIWALAGIVYSGCAARSFLRRAFET